MKKEEKLLWFPALVLVAALLFLNSIPASAGENPGRGKSLAEARKALEQELLPLSGAGFVGIGHSEAEDEVIVLVEDKQTKRRVPRSFEGYTVVTQVTGKIQTLSNQVVEPVTSVSEDRQGEVRSLVGGTSLSAYVTKESGVYRYAGTLGMVTYDNKILSNAHVIAMKPGTNEFLNTGTPIIQPGTCNGGEWGDQVGELEDYIPIDFEPNTENYADAAVGSIDAGVGASLGGQFDEEGNYWIEGWIEVSKGDSVRKSGRTTGVTKGEVVYTNASVWVRYGDQSAYFVDQILVAQENWSFAARGDSGSAVDKDGEFAGLVFAGSDTLVAINKAEHIIAGLGIAVELPEGRCSLTASSTPGGSVCEPGEGMFIYDAGTSVALVAEAEEDYQFVNWTGDVDAIGDVYAATTDIAINDSCSVTANFELKEGRCSLNISSTRGGSITQPGEGMFIYDAGTSVTLVAEAEEDYQFVKWTGDVDAIGDAYAAATNITMNESGSVTANFALKKGRCSLAISSTPGGSVAEPGAGMHIYKAGEVVFLVAEAEEDYQFVKWTGDVDAISDVDAATTNITMDGSYSITANFKSWHPDPLVQLTVSSTGGGSVADAGEGIFFFPLGTEVSLAAKPDEGYQFIIWSGEVNAIADVSAASTTITMDNSYSVRANFESAGGGCFIATAAYGTPMAEEIQILREFRDDYLLTNPVGQAFVDFYYRTSPPIAQFISEHPSLKPIVRAGLVPAVGMSTVAVDTTLNEKVAIAGLLGLVSVALTVWVTKRRGRGPGYSEDEMSQLRVLFSRSH
jgi:chaperone required for assembly of F1-ATPase